MGTLSTALKNRLLGGGSGDDDIKSLFAEGYIVIYDGAVPEVDSTSVGNVLCILTADGTAVDGTNGLNLGTASAGAIPKAAEDWEGTVSNAGAAAATYFRFVQNAANAGAVATLAATTGATALRMQGTIGTNAGFDMIVTNPVLADTSVFGLPTGSLFF